MKHNGFKIDGRTLRSVRYRLADEANRLKRLIVVDGMTGDILVNTPSELVAAWYNITDAIKKIDQVLFY